MLAALSPIDYGLLGLYLALLVVSAFYFAARQRDADEFLLAGRNLKAIGLGLSLPVPLVVVLGLWQLPALSYERGLVTWVVPASLILALPLVLAIVIPLARGLALGSVFEYFEMRFDRGLRGLACWLFFLWRLALVAVLLVASARIVTLASSWPIPVWFVVLILGLMGTMVTFLGGLRAMVWSGGMHLVAIGVGLAVVVAAIWLQLAGEPERVVEVARGLGRDRAIDVAFGLENDWLLWTALPSWVLAALAMVAVDQAQAARILGARSVEDARRGYVVGMLASGLLVIGLLYVGLCLLTYYYDHPEHMRAAWVANIDSQTRLPATDHRGRPLLDERNPAHEITAVTIDQLIAERRLLRPNTHEPLVSSEGLIDPDSGQIVVERLAQRKPPTSRLNGEWIVSRSAPLEMLPRFIAERLPLGAAGLALVGVLGAALAGFEAGLAAVVSVIVFDMHRGLGWGRERLARKLNKPPESLSPQDELRVARPLVLVVGLALTAVAVGLSLAPWTEPFTEAIVITSIGAGPLLAVFLLGMLSRTATPAGAKCGLVAGIVLSIALTSWLHVARVSIVWQLPLVVLATALVGYAASFLVGHKKSRHELRGLVAGCGTLGVRAHEEEVSLVGSPPDLAAERWK